MNPPFLPSGRNTKFYHIKFRVRDTSRTQGWRDVFRSCGTTDYEAARIRAAEILFEEVGKSKGMSMAPKTVAGTASATSVAPVQPDKPVGPPTIEEVIAMHKQWMASAKPGEKRPTMSTATGYYNRLRQLCRLLDVDNVVTLSKACEGLKPDKIGVTPANFVPLFRNASGVFRRVNMEYYKKQGFVFDVPMKSGPAVRVNSFDSPPTMAQVDALQDRARRDLKASRPRDYLAVLLMLNSGLRAQEAAHVRWKDVEATGIRVAADAGQCTARPDQERYRPKNKPSIRLVPTDAAILKELEQYRELPHTFVISDGKGPGKVENFVAKTRCSRVFRRLARWLKAVLPEVLPEVRNPNHWLRKVYGSVVAQKTNLQTAGEYLGHTKGSPVTHQTYTAILNRPAVSIRSAPTEPKSQAS